VVSGRRKEGCRENILNFLVKIMASVGYEEKKGERKEEGRHMNTHI
jgi:hypothetical protein